MDPLSFPALARHMWMELRETWRELVVFELVFQALRAWLVAPLIAITLAFILLRSGQAALSNQEIISFLLTPLGMFYATVLGVIAAALFLLEQAGMLAVVATVYNRKRGVHLSLRRRLQLGLLVMWRVSRLGMTKLALLAFTFAPLVIVGLLTYLLLLTRYDIYYYINARPLSFWVAAVIGGVLATTATIAGIFLFVRWSLALPILLFETVPATQALIESRNRVRGAAWPIGRALIGWLLAMALIWLAMTGAYRLMVSSVIGQFGEQSLTMLSGLLMLQAALVATLSFVTAVGMVLLVHYLYLVRRPCETTQRDFVVPPVRTEISPDPPWLRAASLVGIGVVILSPLTAWGGFAQKVANRLEVQVTAHRGLSKQAPENTLVAIQKAIEIGADYVEIDVHQTSDGVVVLMHDRDLRRVAGDSRRLDQVTFEEARQLDVGGWFAPEFAGEQIPTLAEAIQLCRGKIRLNIEIKVFGEVEPLAQTVADVVSQEAFEQQCVVTSLNYEVLQGIRRHNSEIPIGIIVAQSIGNLNRLDVDAISVRAVHLTDVMIRLAHLQDRQVMVWGISGERQITRQLQRGVDNLITSDPQLAMRLRDQWHDYSDHERLIIASRLLLGLSPQPGSSP